MMATFYFVCRIATLFIPNLCRIHDGVMWNQHLFRSLFCITNLCSFTDLTVFHWTQKQKYTSRISMIRRSLFHSSIRCACNRNSSSINDFTSHSPLHLSQDGWSLLSVMLRCLFRDSSYGLYCSSWWVPYL